MDQREQRLDFKKDSFVKGGFWTPGILQNRIIELFDMLYPLRKGRITPKVIQRFSGLLLPPWGQEAKLFSLHRLTARVEYCLRMTPISTLMISI